MISDSGAVAAIARDNEGTNAGNMTRRDAQFYLEMLLAEYPEAKLSEVLRELGIPATAR